MEFIEYVEKMKEQYDQVNKSFGVFDINFELPDKNQLLAMFLNQIVMTNYLREQGMFKKEYQDNIRDTIIKNTMSEEIK